MKGVFVAFIAVMTLSVGSLFACPVATVGFTRNSGTPCVNSNRGQIAASRGDSCVQCVRTGRTALSNRWQGYTPSADAVAAACTDAPIWGPPPQVVACGSAVNRVCSGSRAQSPDAGMQWVRGPDEDFARCWNVGCAEGTYFDAASMPFLSCIPCEGGLHRRIRETVNPHEGTIVINIEDRN